MQFHHAFFYPVFISNQPLFAHSDLIHMHCMSIVEEIYTNVLYYNLFWCMLLRVISVSGCLPLLSRRMHAWVSYDYGETTHGVCVFIQCLGQPLKQLNSHIIYTFSPLCLQRQRANLKSRIRKMAIYCFCSHNHCYSWWIDKALQLVSTHGA